jgi:hypothetical protein
VAVNPDTRETDLSRIGTKAALGMLTAFRTDAADSADAGGSVAAARRGRPIWDYLLLLVLAILTAETVYGNTLRGKPGRKPARSAGTIGEGG